jgi:hypothetical protein
VELLMRRFRWPLLILAACLVGGAVGAAVWAVWVRTPSRLPRPLSVPSGDQEIAWINNPTGGEAWSLFVIGLKRAEMPVDGVSSGLLVDDANAFPEHSTAVPEVVVSRAGYAGKLRVRWYKVAGEATTERWVKALAARDPAPLAFIGGWTSDRAHELALALDAQATWRGDRPLLLITTATIDTVYPPTPGDADSFPRHSDARNLIDVYEGRSFRFCFSNRQMAQAVTDYVLQDPTLHPGPTVRPEVRTALAGAAGPWAALLRAPDLATPEITVFALEWADDPYSGDLCNKFGDAITARLLPTTPDEWGQTPPGAPRLVRDRAHPIPFSVGGFSRPNAGEAAAIRDLLRELPPSGERSLLVIPTGSSAPARRVLLALSERVPASGRRLVAVTGDGLSVNTFYRDAEWAWPARSIPIPLVLFTHHNPFGWDQPGGPEPPRGYRLEPKNTTEEVLLENTLMRVVADAVFQPPPPGAPPRIVFRADQVRAKLHTRPDKFFDDRGNRRGMGGEHVVVVRPTVRYGDTTPGKPKPDATIEVYRRQDDGATWARAGSVRVLGDRPADRSAPE